MDLSPVDINENDPNSFLLTIPDEIWLKIISFFDSASTLRTLILTCRHFARVADSDKAWRLIFTKILLGSNKDLNCRFSYKMRNEIAYRWKRGIFRRNQAANFRKKCMPCLEYRNEGCWFSNGASIRFIPLKKNGELARNSASNLKTLSSHEKIENFSTSSSHLVAGTASGALIVWNLNETEKFQNFIPTQENSEIHSIDLMEIDGWDQLIATGSRDGYANLFRFSPNENSKFFAINRIYLQDRVWTVALRDNLLFAGTAALSGAAPLNIIDVETSAILAQLLQNSRRGAGVLALAPEGPQSLVTGGYDTVTRVWDLRSFECVMQWMEPYDSTIFSLASDDSNVILAGTSRHSLIWALDKRRPKIPVQSFFAGSQNSPVFSLDFNLENLFVALDSEVVQLRF